MQLGKPNSKMVCAKGRAASVRLRSMKKMRIQIKPLLRISIYNYLVVSTVISVILFMQPYFTWISYKYHTIFSIIQYANLIVGLFFLCLSLLLHQNSKTQNKVASVSGILLFFLLADCYFTGENSLAGGMGVFLQFVYIFLFSFMDNRFKGRVLDLTRKVFAISVLPAVAVFILRFFLNVDLPYDLLEDYRLNSIRIYLHYPGSILSAHLVSVHIPMFRLLGYLDEPGALGTYCFFFLVADEYALKKSKINIILFIEGVLSFSTAFYILSVLYIFIRYLAHEGKINKVKTRIVKYVCVIVGLLAGFAVVFREAFNQVMFLVFQKFTVDDVRGGKHILTETIKAFRDTPYKWILGDGYYSNPYGGASWEAILHDIGFIGVGLTMCYIILYSYSGRMNKHRLLLRFLIFLSALQRPYIVTVPYMIIFTSLLDVICISSAGEQISAKRKRLIISEDFV